MNKRLTYSLALAFVLILCIASVSAGILDWFKNEKEIRVNSLDVMNVTDKEFNIKKMELEKEQVCVEDSKNKISAVKDNSCIKDKKGEYVTLDISDSDYFKENSQGLVRFRNG